VAQQFEGSGQASRACSDDHGSLSRRNINLRLQDRF
jgi:hypothetical protein